MNTYYVYSIDPCFPEDKELLMKIGADNMREAMESVLEYKVYDLTDIEQLLIEKVC